MDTYFTKKIFTCREDKMGYVYDKYKKIIDNKSILDIGADKGYLRQYINSSSPYMNIGFGDSIIREWNLENIPYPFEEKSFDTVLCLDVLEHLEHIHAAFDECMRIAKEHVIISLPNAYLDFYSFLKNGKYKGGPYDMKFYGLPLDPPDDRHRWFFGPEEALNFIIYRANKANFTLEQFDCEQAQSTFFEKLFFKKYFSPTFRETLLTSGTLWFILQRNS